MKKAKPCIAYVMHEDRRLGCPDAEYFELLQGGVAAEIGSVIFHIAHFRLLVSVRGQGAFSVAVHIQRHDHISAAAQFNGVGFHGIQAGSVAVAQQDRRCRGFDRGCFGDIELGVAGGAHIGGEGQIFGADGAAAVPSITGIIMSIRMRS